MEICFSSSHESSIYGLGVLAEEDAVLPANIQAVIEANAVSCLGGWSEAPLATDAERNS